MASPYIRLGLHRKRDQALLVWLEQMREPGEEPANSIRRFLYKLYLDDKRSKEKAVDEKK